MTTKPLTPEQKADANRLDAALIEAKLRDPTLTQAEIADRCGWNSQGSISQFAKGNIPLNAKALAKIAKVIGVSAEDISPSLALEQKKLNYDFFGKTVDNIEFGLSVKTLPRKVKAISSPDEIEHDIIQVPRYTLRASAGGGQPILDIDEQGAPNYCRREWATKLGLLPEKLFTIVASGDSMSPTITDGASLMVYGTDSIINGRIHVICRDGDCFVKRLFKQFDGSLLVKSDNEKNYRDIIIRPDDELGLHLVGVVVSVTNNV